MYLRIINIYIFIFSDVKEKLPDDNKTLPKVSITPEPAKKNITTTTAATTTSEITTTIPPSTSTSKTTTTSPTTTTSKSTSTTFSTTTATTPKPTVKPKPHEPEILQFNVTGSNNITCIMLKMTLVFDVKYKTKNNTQNTTKIIVPKEATSTGNCGDMVQNITILWKPDQSGNFDNVTLEFKKNVTSKKFMISMFSGQLLIDKENFPDAESKFLYQKKTNILNRIIIKFGIVFGLISI